MSDNQPSSTTSVTSSMMTKTKTKTKTKKLVIATRLHLGRASAPPSDTKLEEQLGNFQRFVESVANHFSLSSKKEETEKEGGMLPLTIHPVIAVDATPKLEGYDYVTAIRTKLEQLPATTPTQPCCSSISILPVTPWGKFVPALNAVVLYSSSMDVNGDLILFVSAEVTTSPMTIQTLCHHVLNDYDNTLVAGAALNGHTYHDKPTTEKEEEERNNDQVGVEGVVVELNGRTCPWNTLAIWNVHKLKRTGFVLCSDDGLSAGVEEVAAIAIQQKLFSSICTKAKLIKVTEINWQESFDEDIERQKWHLQKMNSKLERANIQLQTLSLSGTVIHC